MDEDGNEIVKEEVPEEEKGNLGGDDPNVFTIPEALSSEAGGIPLKSDDIKPEMLG